MHTVVTDVLAEPDVDVLPADQIASYLEACTLLVVSPLAGKLLNPRRPGSNMRTTPFGSEEQGLVTYYVLQARRLVVVVSVIWIG